MRPLENFSAEDTVRIQQTAQSLTEKGRRLYLAREAISYGWGGCTAVAKAAGVCLKTITRGIRDIRNGQTHKAGERDRKPGAGRPTVARQHKKAVLSAFAEAGSDIDGIDIDEAADIYHVITTVAEISAYGDPMTDKKWINVTAKIIQTEIVSRTGQMYSKTSIKTILRKMGYSLQKNQKYNQVGASHPMRNSQFLHIEKVKEEYLSKGWPIISIDAKAKEKIGDFINVGREYRRKGEPRRVLDHDFAFKFNQIYPEGSSLVPDEMMDKAAMVLPYGVYCVNDNTALVTLGISHDTSEFAADSIHNWWERHGKIKFPNAGGLLILADGGGSNRVRGWLFKIAIQQLSDDLGIPIEICHYPPGCSKYDPIERRLWSQVSRAWTAKPLKNLEVIKEYIGFTSTSTGLVVESEINSKVYYTEQQKTKKREKGLHADGIFNAEELRQDIQIEFFGENDDMKKWNYKCSPHEVGNRWKEYRKAS